LALFEQNLCFNYSVALFYLSKLSFNGKKDLWFVTSTSLSKARQVYRTINSQIPYLILQKHCLVSFKNELQWKPNNGQSNVMVINSNLTNLRGAHVPPNIFTRVGGH